MDFAHCLPPSLFLRQLWSFLVDFNFLVLCALTLGACPLVTNQAININTHMLVPVHYCSPSPCGDIIEALLHYITEPLLALSHSFFLLLVDREVRSITSLTWSNDFVLCLFPFPLLGRPVFWPHEASTTSGSLLPNVPVHVVAPGPRLFSNMESEIGQI